MPRPARVPRVTQSNSLVAAGQNMRTASTAPRQTTYKYGQPWQGQAWHYYDTVGELRYAATYFSKVLSRARLYPATREGKNFTEVDNGSVYDVVSEFFGGPEGQSQALASIGVHLFIVGECFVVRRAPRWDRKEPGAVNPDDPRTRVSKPQDIWEVVGIEEMQTGTGAWTINYSDGKPIVTLLPDEDVIRVWYPHPRKRVMADSPVQSVLGSLAEIERLTQHIMAQIVSRLTGAGLLLLPQGMTFPTPPGQTMPEDATDADKVMAVLFESMMTAVKNPGDASAVAPIVMLVPDEFVDKANLLKFWSDLDQHSIDMRAAAVRRLAIGLDLPVEVLTGTADVNHWGSWQIAEESIKAHVEPALELIVSALSTQYVVEASGVDNAAMRYDTSQLRLRPNRSKEAIELFDRGELDADALRRETGFSDDDKPDPEEMKSWYLKKVASNSSATPEMMAAALLALGVDLGPGILETIRITERAPVDQQTVKDARPDPSLQDHPTQDLPQTQNASVDPSLAAAVDVGYIRAAEGVALRALERAGNRLRSASGQRPACTASAVHTLVPAKPADLDRLLDGAWDHIPQVMRGMPYDQQVSIQAGLDSYLRAVLVGQKEHDIDLLKRHLMLGVVRDPV